MLSLAEFKNQREEKKAAKLESKRELEEKIFELCDRHSSKVQKTRALLEQFELNLVSCSSVSGMEHIIERLETLIDELAHLQRTENYMEATLALEKLKYHCWLWIFTLSLGIGPKRGLMAILSRMP